MNPFVKFLSFFNLSVRFVCECSNLTHTGAQHKSNHLCVAALQVPAPLRGWFDVQHLVCQCCPGCWCEKFLICDLLESMPQEKLVAARNVSVALRLHSFDSKEPSKTQDFFPHEEWLEKYNAEAFVSSFVMVQQLWLLQPCCLGDFNWLGAHPQLQFVCPWLPMTIAKSQKLPNPTLTYHSNLWTYHLPLHTPAQYVVQFQSTAHPDNDQSVSASLFHATPTNGCGWTPKKTVNEQRKTVSAPPVSFNHPQVCSCKHRLAVRCSDPRSPTFQVGLNIFLCQK